MKLLAISDTYIPHEFMQQGFATLADLGVEVEVRRWEHATLIDLQQANLAIENGGPDAVTLPPELDRERGRRSTSSPCSSRRSAGGSSRRPRSSKVIGVLRGGTENIDVEYATGRGIAVLNTPGRNARAVAECAMGMILSEIRNIARAHACLQARPVAAVVPQQRRDPRALRARRSGWSATGPWGGWWPDTCRPSAAASSPSIPIARAIRRRPNWSICRRSCASPT